MLGRLAAPLALVAVMVATLWAGGLAVGQEVGQPVLGESVLVGAGDIASCGSPGTEATAALLMGIGGTVATFGDNAYPRGTDADFAGCYDPTWGLFKERTNPSPGNHEYMTAGASGYFNYFGAAAGDPDKGYYSYDLGSWHVISLNSNCSSVAGGCAAGSPQEQWLKNDLAAHSNACTLAYWHHPRFSSGMHGSHSLVAPFWNDLYEAGADVVLSGHDHDYERFAPLNPSGQTDPARGIREFVVGTGGAELREFDRILPTSEVQIAGRNGVLKMTLHPEGYDWQFITAPAATVADSGSGQCHGATTTDTNTTGVMNTTGTTSGTSPTTSTTSPAVTSPTASTTSTTGSTDTTGTSTTSSATTSPVTSPTASTTSTTTGTNTTTSTTSLATSPTADTSPTTDTSPTASTTNTTTGTTDTTCPTTGTTTSTTSLATSPTTDTSPTTGTTDTTGTTTDPADPTATTTG